jgi:hypothetical protein
MVDIQQEAESHDRDEALMDTWTDDMNSLVIFVRNARAPISYEAGRLPC